MRAYNASMHTAPLSRRRLLRASAAALIAANLWPGVLAADVSPADSGAFRFVVVNDLHYFDADCGPFFQRVVSQIRAHRDEPGGLDLVLLAGDLSDWGQSFQFAAVKDLFKTVGVPFHVTCGNHDWADWGDRNAFLDAFPAKEALNYAFEHKGWQIVGFDSSNQNLKSRVKVTPEAFGWLDDHLPKLDRKRPLIVFTHFPMHPDLQWPSASAADVLNRLKEHNLQGVFGGHCHAYRTQLFQRAVCQTNVCCSHRVRNHDPSQSQKGYFLCQAKEGKVERKFVEVKPI